MITAEVAVTDKKRLPIRVLIADDEAEVNIFNFTPANPPVERSA